MLFGEIVGKSLQSVVATKVSPVSGMTPPLDIALRNAPETDAMAQTSGIREAAAMCRRSTKESQNNMSGTLRGRECLPNPGFLAGSIKFLPPRYLAGVQFRFAGIKTKIVASPWLSDHTWTLEGVQRRGDTIRRNARPQADASGSAFRVPLTQTSTTAITFEGGYSELFVNSRLQARADRVLDSTLSQEGLLQSAIGISSSDRLLCSNKLMEPNSSIYL
jgi:hypothetical protein